LSIRLVQMTPPLSVPTPQRSDARRNYDALLEAGRITFSKGPEVSFEDVARAAGVGKGTLYRHFPTRDHLAAAIMQDGFDRLAAKADELLNAQDPWAAMEFWLRDYDRTPMRYPGISARLGDALADDASAVATACLPMKLSFAELLRRAQGAGVARDDLTPTELLTLISALPQKPRNSDRSSPYLDLILRGLRP
jgi:AcrR family transcriptional regulator